MPKRKAADGQPLTAAQVLDKHLTADAQLKARRNDAVVARVKRERDAAIKALEESELRFDNLVELDSARRPLAPWQPRKGHQKHGDKRVAAAFAGLSDVHCDEIVDPRKVNGLNRHNPAISSFRLQRHREGVEWLVVEQQARMFEIRDLYLWLGGDLSSGFIHLELLESNALSPTEGSLFMLYECSETLRHLLRTLPNVRIHVLCNYGNHGRTDQKKKIKTGARNSYEWQMYQMLRKEFAAEERVDFDIARGEVLYTDIYGATVRWTHGDATNYSGGVHGLSIPLGKAVMKWDRSRKAALTIMGHYHTYFPGKSLIVNNSVIGYSEFSAHIQAEYSDPSQLFLLWDMKRGPCQQTEVWVGDRAAEDRIRETLPAWWVQEMGDAAE